jgi:hypothetical protein
MKLIAAVCPFVRPLVVVQRLARTLAAHALRHVHHSRENGSPMVTRIGHIDCNESTAMKMLRACPCDAWPPIYLLATWRGRA